MSCNTCAHWRAPVPEKRRYGGRPEMGRCVLDNQLSHPGYHCTRFSASLVSTATLGLTDIEVDWLRANRGNEPAADQLIGLYRAIRDAPEGTEARQSFTEALAKWRRERSVKTNWHHEKPPSRA